MSFLYHATHVKHLPSIVAEGISPAYACGKMRVVWLHTYGRVPWARVHVAGRHGWALEDIVTLRLPAETPAVHFGPASGCFYTPETIPSALLSLLRPGGGRPRPLIPWA